MLGENSYSVLLLMGVIYVIVFALFVLLIVHVFMPFNRDRNYIKMEMERSDNEREYNFWKKQLRRLYLKHIPIVGFFIK